MATKKIRKITIFCQKRFIMETDNRFPRWTYFQNILLLLTLPEDRIFKYISGKHLHYKSLSTIRHKYNTYRFMISK